MFYDLNIQCDGVKDHSRREMVAMAMQMGYSGIAANHVVVGLMSDADRCRIAPLPVTAILSASPALAEAAKFHREVLGVPVGQPFRQYTRLTVVVDSPVQAAALNAANPVLRTYDVVAVQPTNEKMFAQACTSLEVDLITLNFTDKPSFRLKLHMIKAAMERGLFFEISYGALLTDLRARRELFTNIKILVGWTRGRNIVVSSGAKTAMELRGPNDAANLASMFGLASEHAKAAVSKNCKSVLQHGVARKRAHKAAIIIDRLPPNAELGSRNAIFDVPAVWDPLSSGAGDIILFEEDRMIPDKSSTDDKKTSKDDFVSAENNLSVMEASSEVPCFPFANEIQSISKGMDLDAKSKPDQRAKKRKMPQNKPDQFLFATITKRTKGRKRSRR